MAHLAAVFLKYAALGLPAYSFNCISRCVFRDRSAPHTNVHPWSDGTSSPKDSSRFPRESSWSLPYLMPSLTGSLVRHRSVLRRVLRNRIVCPFVKVYPLGLSFRGAPLATAISFNIVALASIFYGYFFVPRTAWLPIGPGVWQGWGLLGRLGIAGIGRFSPSISGTSGQEC